MVLSACLLITGLPSYIGFAFKTGIVQITTCFYSVTLSHCYRVVYLLKSSLRAFIAVKRHHNHCNSYKERVSEVSSIIIMVGSVVMWCCRS